MDLYLFRLSLKEKQNLDLFEVRGPAGEPISREGWLRHFFAQPHEFRHYGSDFLFKPESINTGRSRPIIIGWIARQLKKRERTPPRRD